MNESAAKRKCELELRTLYTPVNSALQDGRYLKPGGYEEFREDKKKFRKAYLGDGKGYLVSDAIVLCSSTVISTNLVHQEAL